MHLTQTHNLKGCGDFRKKKKQLYLCPVAGCLRSFPDNPFTSMATVKNHYANMHAEKKLVCTVCGKTMSAEKQLNLHMKSCGKMFVCRFCNVPYASLEGVARHQMSIHTAAYRRAKSANMHHSCYTVQDDRETRSVVGATALSGGKQDKAEEKGSNKKSTFTTISPQPECAIRELSTTQPKATNGQPQGNTANQTSTVQLQSSHSHVKIKPKLIHSESNRNNRTRYTPLLPKPATPTCRILKIGSGDMREMSTQTDLLGAAVRCSNIALEDQWTNTNNNLTKTFASAQSQCMMLPRYSQSNHLPTIEPLFACLPDCAGNRQWNDSIVETGSSTCATSNAFPQSHPSIPTDFSTQTSFTDVSMTPLNSNLGTQTTFSTLLEVVDGSSSSIELQCNLGNEPMQSSLPLDEAMSFGTQTNLPYETRSFLSDACIQSAAMSSFGTQTTKTKNSDKFSELVMSEPFPLQHSTSDFSMQFPYELMDFGTQTTLFDSANQLPEAFTFDEYLNDQSTGSPAQLSQSSTQTDLDFWFNHIETQTDWCV
ncbi:ATM interactor-like [Watersipora subatra]|uniref:ATM interactor-like n=1 Tax=Watersipora subatra TaxID=2589382 RepID=UPI00355AE63A